MVVLSVLTQPASPGPPPSPLPSRAQPLPRHSWDHLETPCALDNAGLKLGVAATGPVMATPPWVLAALSHRSWHRLEADGEACDSSVD